MIILFWFIMGLLFLQCFKWAVAPFIKPKSDGKYTHITHITEINHSFNSYRGHEYNGIEDTEREFEFEGISTKEDRGKRW